MNNKEFISALAQKSGYKISDTQQMVRSTTNAIVNKLCEDEVVSLSGFGNFEVKKRQERIIVNPGTGQKMLVPPKLVVNFKPIASLKEKLK